VNAKPTSTIIPVLIVGYAKNSSDRMVWTIPGTTLQIERWVKRSCGNVAKSTRTTRWVAFETKANRAIALPADIKPHETAVAAWLMAHQGEIGRGELFRPAA
jgi:hypothetical protein